MLIIYSIAFAWVFTNDIANWIDGYLVRYQEKLKPKPFRCLKCMSGWAALIGGFCTGYGWESFLLCFLTMAVASIIEGIKMRYL